MYMYKKLYYTGFLAYACLLALAVVFYKERTILLDNSLLLFEMLKDGDFSIGRNRIIGIFPQLFPLLATKLALSLKWVMISYSAGYMLYHIVCYALCGLLKNYRLGIALLLVNTLIVAHTFFWHLSELGLGISLMFPLFALIVDAQHRLSKPVVYALLTAGTAVLVFSHPLIVFPFYFFCAFAWLNKSLNTDKRLLTVIIVLFTVGFLAKTFLMPDSYENNSMGQLANFKWYYPDYFKTYSNIRFFDNWLYVYYWLPVFYIASLVFYAVKKRWMLFILVLLSCFVYSQIVNISYPEYKDTYDFHWEYMYTTLCLFLALPIMFDIFPAINKHKIIVPAIVGLVVITALLRVNMIRKDYRGRIDWYRGYAEKYGKEKMMVGLHGKPMGSLLIEWASPYEFWLLSTVEKDTTVSIIIHKNVDEIGWAWDQYRGFVTTWGVYPYKDLNPRYFKFRDTSTHYSVYKDR